MTGKFTILALEESETTRSWLEEFLGFNGYEVFSAPIDRLSEAVNWDLYDLILIDHAGAEDEAFEACEVLRARPATENVPIILLTDEDGERTISRASAAQVNGILRKPLNTKMLLRAVRVLTIEHRQMAHRNRHRAYGRTA